MTTYTYKSLDVRRDERGFYPRDAVLVSLCARPLNSGIMFLRL